MGDLEEVHHFKETAATRSSESRLFSFWRVGFGKRHNWFQ